MSSHQRLSVINSLITKYKQQFKNIQNPKVKIVEVGPRDGLQNEKTPISLETKTKFINLLSETGLQTIESGSFVSPKWVPQMDKSGILYQNIDKKPNISYPALVPNIKGLESAIEYGIKEIAIFGAASEGFTQKNINCSIEESLKRFKAISEVVKQNKIKMRGYVSCVMGCPYEGEVNVENVINVTQKLFELGCYEVSLGDTIGVGTPEKTEILMTRVKQQFDLQNIAVHFHDTYDKAIENILISLGHGVRVVDSSVGGLGGCPYAQTKAGNVCTENVVYVLEQLGFQTGVDLDKIRRIGEFITQELKRENMCVV